MLSLVFAYLPSLLLTALFTLVLSLVTLTASIASEKIKALLVSTLTINNSDPLYQVLLDYLKLKKFINASSLSCSTKQGEKNNNGRESTINDLPILNLHYGTGIHDFIYKNTKISVKISDEGYLSVGYRRTPKKIETLTFSCNGMNKLPLLKEILEDALHYNIIQDKDKTIIYSSLYGGLWEKTVSKRKRTLDTVILSNNTAQETFQDLQTFLQNQNWYFSRGVPYRRGYIFYGPPGSGKTSLALALAGELNMSICMLNFGEKRLNDENLIRFMEKIPLNSILLIEDVDSIFADRISGGGERGTSLSFSGLLNALDGIRSKDGVIVIMTTNHIEKLDPALLRPGRADVHVRFDYAKEEQIRRMFLKFYLEEKEEMINDFVNNVPENKISMASLQAYFLVWKDEADKALSNTKNLMESNEFSEEMGIAEWLIRLNLSKYADNFRKEGIFTVSNLKRIGEGDLSHYGLKTFGEKKRVVNMLKGEENTKKAFQLLSKTGVRAVVMNYTSDENLINSIVENVTENFISEFILRDFFDYENKDLDAEKMKVLLERVKRIKKGKAWKQKINYPKEKPIQILERLNLNDFIKKFEEEKVLDEEIFYKLDERKLEGVLEIKSVGAQMKLLKIIKDFNDNKEKMVEEEEKTELPNLGFLGMVKKQSSVYY